MADLSAYDLRNAQGRRRTGQHKRARVWIAFKDNDLLRNLPSARCAQLSSKAMSADSGASSQICILYRRQDHEGEITKAGEDE